MSDISKFLEETLHRVGLGALKPQAEKPVVRSASGPIHGGGCRLVCKFPPEETGSWISGTPSLPSGVDWPTFQGEHLTFLAQINLRDVPRDAWGGLHPENGWFVIFYREEDEEWGSLVSLLHTEELGSLRPVPKKYPASASLGRRYDPLGEEGETEFYKPSRWPVEIIRETSPKSPSGKNIIGNRIYDNFDILAPGWQPFNRETMKALHDCIISSIKNNIVNLETAHNGGDAIISGTPVKDMISECRSAIDQIISRSSQYSNTNSISPEVSAQEIQGLTEVTYPQLYAGPVIMEVNALRNIQRGKYTGIHEYLARETYLQAPESLSSSVREIYEKIWKEAAEIAFGHIGGRPTYVMEEYNDRGIKLLELPSSSLFGLQFGDVSNVFVSIDQDKFEREDWNRCNGYDSHGI